MRINMQTRYVITMKTEWSEEAWLIKKMSHCQMLLVSRYSIQLIHDIVESTSLLVHCFPMPLNSVILNQILHTVAEVVSHPHHHIKTFLIPGQCMLIKKSLHNLVDGVVRRPCLGQLFVRVEHRIRICREVPCAHFLLAVVEDVHHLRHPLL
uniref:Uncharacterized protein n=1 Tax=Arundo donax TaxID=35708 RepID=A0A0A9B346_ARUDO